MQKKRIKLTIAYDGTNYCGWQVQPNGITVEEVINKVLCKLTGEDIAVIGASRTDSGVYMPLEMWQCLTVRQASRRSGSRWH